MTEAQQTDTQWVANELALLEAVAGELEAYIVNGEVYRTVSIATPTGTRKVTMSGGDLLARLNRLRTKSSTLSADQQRRFDQVASAIQATIYSLRTRFHDLLRRELKSRNDQLKWDTEIRRNRENESADAAEVQNRQTIAAIQAALKEA